MSEARHSVATGVIDGKIFTVGGYGEKIGQSSEMPILDIVECFDPQENM
jgi:N-acetylneuraminic acid mutarotase